LEVLQPLKQDFDAESFQRMLQEFSALAREAELEELRQLLKLMVRRIIWMPNGRHRVQYHYVPKRVARYATQKENQPPPDSGPDCY
jgi:hypothetical protein